MRTQPHKSHVIDDLIDELDKLTVYLRITSHNALTRGDLVTVRRDILVRISEVLSEARRRLETHV